MREGHKKKTIFLEGFVWKNIMVDFSTLNGMGPCNIALKYLLLFLLMGDTSCPLFANTDNYFNNNNQIYFTATLLFILFKPQS